MNSEKKLPGAGAPGGENRNADNVQSMNSIPRNTGQVKPSSVIVIPRKIYDFAEEFQRLYWEHADLSDGLLVRISEKINNVLAEANSWQYDRRRVFPIGAIRDGLQKSRWNLETYQNGTKVTRYDCWDHPTHFWSHDGTPAAALCHIYTVGGKFSDDHRNGIKEFAQDNNLTAIFPAIPSYHHPACRIVVYLPAPAQARRAA